MTEYKHFENKAVRMTSVSDEDLDKLKKDTEAGINIYAEFGEFTFFPSNVIEDHLGDPILYVKFNHKEKLVLYHTTQHPESRQALEKFKLSIMIASTISNENYVVRDIMDYIKEIEKVAKDLKDGKVKLKDGIHPSMKDAFK